MKRRPEVGQERVMSAGNVELVHGDAVEFLRKQKKFSLFIVTDPPINWFVRELHDAAHTYVMVGGQSLIKEGPRFIQGQKEPEVYAQIIALFPSNWTVVDPFMGTGTIGEAALSLGRNFIGIENVFATYQVAKARLLG